MHSRPARRARYDVSLPNGWPVYPTPVACERCSGRIHQLSLRADPLCAGCTPDAHRLSDRDIALLLGHAA